MLSPNEPHATEQSDQRHDVRGDGGDDGVRHCGGSPEISRVDSGGRVSGSAAGTVACHATVIAASVDPGPAVATGIASQTANSNIVSAPAELADKSPSTAPDNGIVAETCPACLGQGRGHFGKCSVCRGTGWVFA
jgi:hypothetical protein